MSILNYDAKSIGAQKYMELAQEFDQKVYPAETTSEKRTTVREESVLNA